MNTVTVWTRQVSQVLEEIERTGSYHVREEYIREKYDVISDHYIERYRWFTQMARKRIRIPEEYVFPIWLALSDAQKLPPAEGTVTFTLEVPEDQILVADMDRWGYCVNRGAQTDGDRQRSAAVHQLKRELLSHDEAEDHQELGTDF